MAWTPARAPPAVAMPPTTAALPSVATAAAPVATMRPRLAMRLPAGHAGDPTGEHPRHFVDPQKAGGHDPGNRHGG